MKAVGRIDRDTLQYQVLVDSQAIGSGRFGSTRVISQKNGQPIRLGDIGRVTVGYEDRTMVIRSGGENAVALTVFRRLGGNALAVSSELERVLADAAKSAPPGVKIEPIYDQGLLVRTAIANVRDAIVIGGCLSVLVLLVFLKSWRATLIASLAIPLSLVISFVFLYLTGDTLNLMSLGGLAVAIGLIIDDTVVVVENIARHLAEGQIGRCGGRLGQPRNQRRRDRLDADHDSRLSAAGAGERRGRAILPVAEHRADRGACWSRWSSA